MRIKRIERLIENKEIREDIVHVFLLVVSSCLCIYAGLKILDMFRDNIQAHTYYKKQLEIINQVPIPEAKNMDIETGISEEIPEKENLMQEETYTRCNESDYIYIYGTDIYYPLVQGEDNTYYLNHLPDGTKNRHGSIFINCQNVQDDFNIIIYGHNMKDGTMFGQLSNYGEINGFAEEHPKMFVSWDGKAHEYSLFSVQTVEYDSEVFNPYPGDIEGWIKNQRLASIIDCGINANADSRFITLSTCGSTDTEKVVAIWKRD